jgi:E3 ubiquitin-protein ligase RNF34
MTLYIYLMINNFTKKFCIHCKQTFCHNCAQKLDTKDLTLLHSRVCNKCNIISSPTVSIEQLMNVETKYLRLYLLNKNVRMYGANEKRDLAQLILIHNRRQNSNNNNNNNNTDSNNNSRNFSTNNNDTDNNNSRNLSNNHSSTNSGNQASRPTLASTVPLSNAHASASLPTYMNNNSNDDRSAAEPAPSLGSVHSSNSNTNNESDVSRKPLKRFASLSDLKSAEDIDTLSVKQIKEILAYNFVDFRGCFEKSELVAKLKRLYSSHLQNKNIENELNDANVIDSKHTGRSVSLEKNQTSEPTAHPSKLISSLSESEFCKICMDRLIDCVLLECGHMVSCVKCGKQLAECPICRQNVVRCIRVFKS